MSFLFVSAVLLTFENEQSLNACFTEVSQLTEASGNGSDSALVRILTKLTGAPLGWSLAPKFLKQTPFRQSLLK